MTEPEFIGKRLVVIRHGHKSKPEIAAEQAIDIVRQLHEAGIDNIDAIYHSPVERAAYTARYFHQALSPELSQHFRLRAVGIEAQDSPTIQEADWLHGLHHDEGFRSARTISPEAQTVALIAHGENLRAYEDVFGEINDASNTPDAFDSKALDFHSGTLASTAVYDLNIQSWSELKPDLLILERMLAFIPEESRFKDLANQQVFDGIEL